MKDQRRGRRVTQRRALLFICVTWGTSGCHGTSPPPADGRGEGSPPAADGVAPVRPSAPVPAPAPAPDAEVRGDAPAGPTNSASATAPSGVPATTADPAVVARAEALLRR
jgi:hypothetical protein